MAPYNPDLTRLIINTTYRVVGEVAEKTRSTEALKDKSQMKYQMVIKGKKAVDKAGNLKYRIKNDMFSVLTPAIRLMGINQGELGRVERYKSGQDYSYGIYRRGERIGIIREPNILSPKMNIAFLGWQLVGKKLFRDFEVYDSSGACIIIVHSAFPELGSYVMEYNNLDVEIMGLLLVLMIELDRRKK